MKSDCGLFSCNVSNEISWREASLNFTIEDKCSVITGLHPSLWPALHCSSIALALSCIAIVSFCLFLPSKMMKGELWRALTVFQQGAVCLSSLLLLVTGFLWIEEKGPSVHLILVLSLLFLVIPVTFTVAAILAIHPPKIKKIMKKKVYQVILDFTAPGGALVMIPFSIFFIDIILQLQGQGCSQPKNPFVGVAVPAGISFLILLSLFGWYHLKKENRKGAGSPSPEKGENEENQNMVSGYLIDFCVLNYDYLVNMCLDVPNIHKPEQQSQRSGNSSPVALSLLRPILISHKQNNDQAADMNAIGTFSVIQPRAIDRPDHTVPAVSSGVKVCLQILAFTPSFSFPTSATLATSLGQRISFSTEYAPSQISSSASCHIQVDYSTDPPETKGTWEQGLMELKEMDPGRTLNSDLVLIFVI
ncbi:uncharacterized protein LOC119929606 [Tachyglossus aculeatus]|uniref:uncharacterized protein LOC119929606 n=1 Tax=Tachyglossus aculeatus TaxID=9261 RepID=UPI0018F59556|nr:uncharacterized protein LOC119929606 [Tachyglossus aculeatus]